MAKDKPIEATVVSGNELPFHERRWVVICLMVFAALFLGFPFLWRSRAFSMAEKIFWTVAVSLETILVFWAFWLVMKWCIERIQAATPIL